MADTVESVWGTTFNFSLTKITSIFKSNKYYTAVRGQSKSQHAIKVTRAPNPNDLIWGNFGVPFSNAIFRRVMTTIATLLLLGASFGAMLGLKVLQYNMNKDTPKFDLSISSLKFRIISICITLVIMIINQLLSRLIRVLTFVERHWTKTLYYQSLTIKIVIVNYINVSLSSLIHVFFLFLSTSLSSNQRQLFGPKVL